MDLSEVVDSEGPRHPWETARAKALYRILVEHGVRRVDTVLDYGCGDAYAGRELAEALGAARFMGVDSAIAEETADMVRNREALGGAQFDLLLLLDVLEHIEDDIGLLDDLCQSHVRPGGSVLIAVPAGPRLFGPHDVALGHVRRYTRARVVEVARAARLRPVGSGNLFAALRAVRAAERAVEKRVPRLEDRPRGIGRWRRGALVSQAVQGVLLGEARVLRWLERRGVYTVGLSTWVLGTRP